MSMSKPAALVMVLALSACGTSDGKNANAQIIHEQIGRFAFQSAQEGFPPMIFDTATGCVMAISKDEDGGISIDEVSFPGGPSSCNAMKQLLVVDTLSRVVK